MLPEIGKHKAKVNGAIIIRDRADDKAGQEGLYAAIPCEVVEGESAGRSIVAFRTLYSKDGTPQNNEVNKLQTIFGHANGDLYWLETANTADVLFEIDVQDEEYNGTTDRKVKWINELGGGALRLEPSDKKKVLSKYGSKFRAMTGGTAVKNASTASKTPPAVPKAKTPPPAPTGPTATMQECWEEFCKANPTLSEEGMASAWFEKIKATFNTENNSDLTPHQWGQLKASLEDNVPT